MGIHCFVLQPLGIEPSYHLDDDWYQFINVILATNTTIQDSQYELVLGGHASMWGENVDSTNFVLSWI